MANLITYSRMIFLIPIAIYLKIGNYNVALALFIVAAFTDWLDGFVARKTVNVTETGKVMDQIADKVLITGTLAFMIETGDVPAWLVATIVWRDFIVSGTRILAAKTGKVIAANIFGKIKTVSQMALIIFLLSKDLFTSIYVKEILIWTVFLATIFSGTIYLMQNRKVFTI